MLSYTTADEVLPDHKANPMIRVHKFENTKMCLDFLKEKGVQVSNITADGTCRQ